MRKRNKIIFVGVRIDPPRHQKLVEFSKRAGEPGNVSAGLRWAIDQVQVSTITETPAERQPEAEKVPA